MVNKEPEIKLETHSLTIPYGFSVFGKMFEMPLECVFGYSGDLKTKHVLEILSLTGSDAEGLTYDMMYLVEDDDNLLTRHIITGILHNNTSWNSEVEEWWSNLNRGLVLDS